MNLREFAQYNTDWATETSGRDPRVEYQDPTILGDGYGLAGMHYSEQLLCRVTR